MREQWRFLRRTGSGYYEWVRTNDPHTAYPAHCLLRIDRFWPTGGWS